MKKLVILMLSLVFFVSCGNSDVKIESNDFTASDSIITAGEQVQITTTENDFNTGDDGFSDNDDLMKISFPAYEEIEEKYPDKTVVTCLIGQMTMMDASLQFRTWEINEYLDSVNSEYAICFLPYTYNGTVFAEAVSGIKAEGTNIDIIIGSTHFGDENNTNSYHTDVLDGLYEPLDKYFELSESGEKYLAMMPESFLDGFRVNGKLYSVGGLINKNLRANGYTINKELAEKYDWDFEKPIVEQTELLKTIKLSECNTDIIVVSNYGSVYCYPKDAAIDSVMGIFWDSERECAERITQSPEYLRGLEDIYYLKQCGVLTYGSSYSKVFIEWGKTIGYEDDCGEFTVTRGENTYTAVNVATSHDYVINSIGGMGIYSGSKNKKAAFEVLMLLLTDPDINNMLVHGKADEDYTLSEDGIVRDAYRIGGNYSRFANMLVCHPFDGCSSDTGSKLVNRYNNAVVMPYVGFGFDSSSVRDIYGKIKSTMANHPFMGYSSAEESLAALDEKLTEAGIDKFLEEYNRQYREWKDLQ